MVRTMHTCDYCQHREVAPFGEEIPNDWIRLRSGALFCTERCAALAQGRPVPRAEALKRTADG